MNSESLTTASSPRPTDNIEVLSQGAPNRGEVVLEAPQGDLPDSRRKGSKTPKGSKFGPHPNTAPEPPVVPDSGSLWGAREEDQEEGHGNPKEFPAPVGIGLIV